MGVQFHHLKVDAPLGNVVVALEQIPSSAACSAVISLSARPASWDRGVFEQELSRPSQK